MRVEAMDGRVKGLDSIFPASLRKTFSAVVLMATACGPVVTPKAVEVTAAQGATPTLWLASTDIFTATPQPSPTPTHEPTSTPDPKPQVLVTEADAGELWAEVQATRQSLIEHEVKGVTVGVEQVQDRQGNLVDLVVVRERETQNIVVHVEGWADKPDKWVVAQAVEGTTQTPFIVGDAWAEIPKELRPYLVNQEVTPWYVKYSNGEYFFVWREQVEVVNEEQLKYTLYPSSRVSTPDKFSYTYASLPVGTPISVEKFVAKFSEKDANGEFARFTRADGLPLTESQKAIIMRYLDFVELYVKGRELDYITASNVSRVLFWDQWGDAYTGGKMFFTERYLNGSFSGSTDVVAASMVEGVYHEAGVHGAQERSSSKPMQIKGRPDAEFQAYYGGLRILGYLEGISPAVDGWISIRRGELVKLLRDRSYQT